MISAERYTRMQNSALFASATIFGPTITADATPHVKSAWTSLISVANFDVYLLCLQVTQLGANATDSSAMIDVGADPAGGTSYDVVVPNVIVGGSNSDLYITDRWFPVFIPKGAQIAVRMQAMVASDTATVGIVVLGGDGLGFHRGAIQDYGTNTADSGAVKMANAAANTKGDWTQLGSNTTRRHSGLVACAAVSLATAAARDFIDIGIDPAGGTNYTVVIPDWILARNSGEEIFYSTYPMALLSLDIPAGSAIAARSACLVTNENSDIEIAVYGF